MSSGFHWQYPDLNHSRFHALSRLLSLKNGGQLCQISVDESIENVGISGGPISKDEAKARFVDRLAEIMSREKGAEYVAAAAVHQSEEVINVWVTRNEGFDEKDREFAATLQNTTASLSGRSDCRHERETNRIKLWTSITAFYSARICHYASLAQHELTEFPIHLYARQSPGLKLAAELGAQLLSLSKTPGDDGLVMKAYEIRRSVQKRACCQIFGTKLWKAICFLSRVREAWTTFLKISKQLSQHKMSIHLISINDSVNTVTKPKIWALSATLRNVGLSYSNGTVRTYFSKEKTLRSLEEQLDRFSRKALHVHAEVQIVLYLVSRNLTTDGVSKYIGCSKLSCFLCKTFLCFMGFQTKGSHGKVYAQWSVPNISNCSSPSAAKIGNSLASLEMVMTTLLKIPLIVGFSQRAESVIATTDSELAATESAATSTGLNVLKDLEETQQGAPEIPISQSKLLNPDNRKQDLEAPIKGTENVVDLDANGCDSVKENTINMIKELDTYTSQSMKYEPSRSSQSKEKLSARDPSRETGQTDFSSESSSSNCSKSTVVSRISGPEHADSAIASLSISEQSSEKSSSFTEKTLTGGHPKFFSCFCQFHDVVLCDLYTALDNTLCDRSKRAIWKAIRIREAGILRSCDTRNIDAVTVEAEKAFTDIPGWVIELRQMISAIHLQLDRIEYLTQTIERTSATS